MSTPQPNALDTAQLSGHMNMELVDTNQKVRQFITDFHQNYDAIGETPGAFLEIVWNKDLKQPKASAIVVWIKHDTPASPSMRTRGWFIDILRLQDSYLDVCGVNGGADDFNLRVLLTAYKFGIFGIENAVLALGLCFDVTCAGLRDLQIYEQATREKSPALAVTNRSSYPDIVQRICDESRGQIISQYAVYYAMQGEDKSFPPQGECPVIFQRPMELSLVHRHVFSLTIFAHILARYDEAVANGTIDGVTARKAFSETRFQAGSVALRVGRLKEANRQNQGNSA